MTSLSLSLSLSRNILKIHPPKIERGINERPTVKEIYTLFQKLLQTCRVN